MILRQGRTITTMTAALTYNGFLNVFSIKGKTIDSRKKAYTFRIAIYNMFTYFDAVNGMCDLLT